MLIQQEQDVFQTLQDNVEEREIQQIIAKGQEDWNSHVLLAWILKGPITL